MNQQIRSIIFGVAGLLVLAGAILFLTHWAVAPYLFAVGAAGIAVCYLTLPVKDLDFRRRRLHRFNVFAGLLMIVSSGFMYALKSIHTRYVASSGVTTSFGRFSLKSSLRY